MVGFGVEASVRRDDIFRACGWQRLMILGVDQGVKHILEEEKWLDGRRKVGKTRGDEERDRRGGEGGDGIDSVEVVVLVKEEAEAEPFR
jgi:hypothetical protein